MSITTHIKTLNNKHKELDDKLHSAYIHYLPNNEISKLKKEKLRIKDEIKNLEESDESIRKAA
jgi:hypothetical protein